MSLRAAVVGLLEPTLSLLEVSLCEPSVYWRSPPRSSPLLTHVERRAGSAAVQGRVVLGGQGWRHYRSPSASTTNVRRPAHRRRLADHAHARRSVHEPDRRRSSRSTRARSRIRDPRQRLRTPSRRSRTCAGSRGRHGVPVRDAQLPSVRRRAACSFNQIASASLQSGAFTNARYQIALDS